MTPFFHIFGFVFWNYKPPFTAPFLVLLKAKNDELYSNLLDFTHSTLNCIYEQNSQGIWPAHEVHGVETLLRFILLLNIIYTITHFRCVFRAIFTRTLRNKVRTFSKFIDASDVAVFVWEMQIFFTFKLFFLWVRTKIENYQGKVQSFNKCLRASAS